MLVLLLISLILAVSSRFPVRKVITRISVLSAFRAISEIEHLIICSKVCSVFYKPEIVQFNAFMCSINLKVFSYKSLIFLHLLSYFPNFKTVTLILASDGSPNSISDQFFASTTELRLLFLCLYGIHSGYGEIAVKCTRHTTTPYVDAR